jgi:hypothetical protein
MLPFRTCLAAGLVIITLASSGCASPQTAPVVALGSGVDVTSLARRHVYVFLMNGTDPLTLGQLSGLRDYVQHMGYTQTYCGQFYHRSWFEQEMCRLAGEDHDSRFVLIGTASAAKALCEMAETAAARGTSIDALLIVNAPPDMELGTSRPVQALPGPSSPETKALLACELDASAAHVSVQVQAPRPFEPGPTPRTLPPDGVHGSGPEWDILQPATQLKAAQ